MKMICINNTGLDGLSAIKQLIIGQIYEVENFEYDENMYNIITPKLNCGQFFKKRFISIKEHRKLKLDKINESR